MWIGSGLHVCAGCTTEEENSGEIAQTGQGRVVVAEEQSQVTGQLCREWKRVCQAAGPSRWVRQGAGMRCMEAGP